MIEKMTLKKKKVQFRKQRSKEKKKIGSRHLHGHYVLWLRPISGRVIGRKSSGDCWGGGGKKIERQLGVGGGQWEGKFGTIKARLRTNLGRDAGEGSGIEVPDHLGVTIICGGGGALVGRVVPSASRGGKKGGKGKMGGLGAFTNETLSPFHKKKAQESGWGRLQETGSGQKSKRFAQKKGKRKVTQGGKKN